MCPGYIVDICPNVAIFRFVTKGIVTSITGEISTQCHECEDITEPSHHLHQCQHSNDPPCVCVCVCVSLCGPVMELDSGYQARRQ